MEIHSSKPENVYLSEYIKFLKTQTLAPAKSSVYYLDQFTCAKHMARILPCTMYLFDFRTQQYLYVSKECASILDYTADELSEKGLDWVLEQIHPNDRQVLTDKAFKLFINSARKLSVDDLRNTSFSVNYRIKRKNGFYIHVFDRYVIAETDRKGNPLVVLGIYMDMSAHKLDSKIIFSIDHYTKDQGFSNKLTTSFPGPEIKLSDREKEVLQLISLGYPTKQIADQLKISAYTVNAHRHNLLEKTGSQNTAQLLSNALLLGWDK